jgi:uncharacterized protein YcfL
MLRTSEIRGKGDVDTSLAAAWVVRVYWYDSSDVDTGKVETEWKIAAVMR